MIEILRFGQLVFAFRDCEFVGMGHIVDDSVVVVGERRVRDPGGFLVKRFALGLTNAGTKRQRAIMRCRRCGEPGFRADGCGTSHNTGNRVQI